MHKPARQRRGCCEARAVPLENLEFLVRFSLSAVSNSTSDCHIGTLIANAYLYRTTSVRISFSGVPCVLRPRPLRRLCVAAHMSRFVVQMSTVRPGPSDFTVVLRFLCRSIETLPACFNGMRVCGASTCTARVSKAKSAPSLTRSRRSRRRLQVDTLLLPLVGGHSRLVGCRGQGDSD